MEELALTKASATPGNIEAITVAPADREASMVQMAAGKTAAGRSSSGKTGKSLRDALQASPTHLLHRALQLALDFHSEAAGKSPITQRQFTVLAAAAGADGSTQNALVKATGIDRSTLADLVSRLLAKGLLQRERSATDGRANTVRLSSSGRAALDDAALAAAAADRRLLSVLSPKKRETLLKLLTHLAAAADGPLAEVKPKRGKGKAGKPNKKKIKAKKARKATEESALTA